MFSNKIQIQLSKIGLRKCCRCKVTKPCDVAYFPTKGNGLSSWCHECVREHARLTMARKRENPITAVIVKATKDKHRKSIKGRESHRRRNAVRNQKRRGTIFKWATNDWELCKRKFRYRCAYCRQKAFLTQDHFIALSCVKCPGTINTNIVPACVTCNSSKGNKSPYKFATAEAIERIHNYFKFVNKAKLQATCFS